MGWAALSLPLAAPGTARLAAPDTGAANGLSFFFFSFIFISWRLITLQYWTGFCHTLT